MSKLNQKAMDLVLNGTREQRLHICEQEPVYYAVYYFPQYFIHKIPPFHYDFYQDFKKLENGDFDEVAWIAFRESAKTALAKIMLCHLICFKKRRFINYDSYDRDNAEAALFDTVVELQTNEKIIADFGHLYYKKRNKNALQEAQRKRIGNFITENGIKVEAYSTQESTRGRLFKNFRPDFYILDDIETFKTKESVPVTQKIIGHIDEMRSGKSVNCGILYLGNLITEDGVVENIIKMVSSNSKGMVRNIPVEKDGVIAWPDKYVHTDKEAYELNKTIEDPLKKVTSLEEKRRSLNSGGREVYEPEMMNNPEKAGDLYFDRDTIKELIEKAKAKQIIKEVAGFKMWKAYNASHAYAGGADTSEGKGLDANASVFIDFTSRPARQVASFQDNNISPKIFAHELRRQGEYYGECLICPELNNTGFATCSELQDIYNNIHIREEKNKVTKQIVNEYGFRSTSGTVWDIMGQFKSAVEDGDLEIYDVDLLWEMYHFKKREVDILKAIPGMTRHYDKLRAAAIAWEMRRHAKVSKKKEIKKARHTGYAPQSEYEG